MRVRVLIGAAMILVGGFILARGLTYTTRHNVVDLGVVRVSADEKRPVSPWIGGVVALAGLALVFAASRKPG
jgi:hypothetical protein